MQLKRTVLIGLAALGLLMAGGVGAQIVRGSSVIERPPGDFTARWVKIDKDPATASYERVYCIAYSEGGIACDFGDVRTVAMYRISR